MTYNSSDLDNDDLINSFVQVPNCEYNFCDDISSNPSLNPSLNILFHNISSLPLHVESLIDQCINPFHVRFDMIIMICLCET